MLEFKTSVYHSNVSKILNRCKAIDYIRGIAKMLNVPIFVDTEWEATANDFLAMSLMVEVNGDKTTFSGDNEVLFFELYKQLMESL